MSDVYDAFTRTRVMRAVKSKNTKPEITLRRLVHRLGYRYRLHGRHLPGTPDLVFTNRRKVICVHGCFWHGHSCARGRRQPKANGDYWRAKIARNVARDAANRAALDALGWSVLEVWECELPDTPAMQRTICAFLNC
jgi:DNA mismatch endonuclease (patch repair protein)